MKKQNFKFAIKSTKFGNAKIENIKAYNFEEAKKMLFSNHPKIALTYTIHLLNTSKITVEEIDFLKSVNPITNFDFNYNSEFYINYIKTL